MDHRPRAIFPRRWICIGRLGYQVPMNRKQRRASGRLGTQVGATARPAEATAAWFNAALAHQRAGRAGEAERVCRHILVIDPGNAQTLHLLGLIEHQCGRSDEAIEHIRKAITRNGRDPAFHHNLGNILRGKGQLAEAMACYERALALAPGAVDALYNLGNACQDLGQPERAIDYFQRALRLRPDAVELHTNLGIALQDLGRLDEAIACYRKALALRPDATETLINLAGALRSQGQLDTAQTLYERALTLQPNGVENLIGLGVVLRDLGRLEEAVACYERALALAPDHPEARNNLGVALVDLGRPEEAIAHYRRVLVLQPDRAELHYNLGAALQRQGRCTEALASYGRALALRRDYAQAHLNRALALLRSGELEEGWQEYEWRFAVNRYDRKFGAPLWSGEPLAGRRILIHAEQGLGDTLQFVRYVPIVAECGGKVILEVPRPLLRLACTVAGVSEIIAAGDLLPGFDCHCPLLSLPRVFKTNLATIPAAVPYLHVPPEASAGWAQRIGPAPGLQVGIVWAGTAVGAIDLRLLQPLWEVSGISWFSLQVGDRAGDSSSLGGIEIVDLSPWLVDFAETAAAVCRLDLVISVDTSVAHLTGALARPIWLLLPHVAEWRWLIQREDSPWYPTARLFCQKSDGNWPGVASEIAAALAQLTAEARYGARLGDGVHR
jgi:tetratricopeptide (TPR) repeat protein